MLFERCRTRKRKRSIKQRIKLILRDAQSGIGAVGDVRQLGIDAKLRCEQCVTTGQNSSGNTKAKHGKRTNFTKGEREEVGCSHQPVYDRISLLAQFRPKVYGYDFPLFGGLSVRFG